MSSESIDTNVEAGTGFLGKEGKTLNEAISYNASSSGRNSKFFRVFTVIAYVSMVSGLGLMLSMYHFFVWDSTMPPVAKVPGHEIY